MMRDHQLIEELLAIDALDGLDGGDRETLDRELAAHGSDCAECLGLRDSFAETAAMLGLSLDPEPVDPSIADAILTAPRAPRIGSGGRVGTDDGGRDAGRGRRVVASLIGIAASIALVAVGVSVLRSGPTQIGGVVSAQRFVSFEGETGQLAMAYEPGQPGLVVVGNELPQLPSGDVLAFWTFRGDTPVSAGCLPANDGHVGGVLPDVEPTETMAVTVEPATCPAAPTGDVVFTATVA